jgi:hypothetical protein
MSPWISAPSATPRRNDSGAMIGAIPGRNGDRAIFLPIVAPQLHAVLDRTVRARGSLAL